MAVSQGFLLGVIEGFYGREWPFEARRAYAAYLSQAGLNTYIYCPKGDARLRKRWREPWPESHRAELQSLGDAFARHRVSWGVGLSPFELYTHYGARERDALRRKVEEIGYLGAPLLAILFDDMPGAKRDLARCQGQIVEDVARWLPQCRLLVCPTYYSFDPALEQHFGAMPDHYWSELGRALPGDVDVFWTGNRVCSETIARQDIERIAPQLGRRIVLWDNYPVNDGALRSKFLYTSPLAGRSRELADVLGGHLCNPMNQPLLSLPALTGLAQLYGVAGLGESDLQNILGQRFWEQLQLDQAAFQSQGLDGMGGERCEQLALVYDALPGTAAREVSAWLRGEYCFDPACLTG